MREDKYGPMLLELFNTTQVPVTSSEAAELVGCSVQRAYAWISSNRQLLIAKGRHKHGGLAYVSKANPVNGSRTESNGEAAVIEAGSTFEVVGISVVGGRVVVTMVDERGATAKFQAVDA